MKFSYIWAIAFCLNFFIEALGLSKLTQLQYFMAMIMFISFLILSYVIETYDKAQSNG